MTALGNDTLDFGAAPGTNIVHKTVACPGMTSDGYVEAFMQGDSTADHNAYEHLTILAKEIRLVCQPTTDAFEIWATTNLRLAGSIAFRYIGVV